MLEHVGSNAGIEYVEDFEKIISILEAATKEHLNNMAHRVSYASIPFEELGTNMSLERDDRKEIFLFIAIYGTALGAAMSHVVTVGSPPFPTNLFALLMAIAGSDNYATGLVVQTTVILRSLIYALRSNDVEMGELKSLLSSAFLNKTYAS